MGDATVIASSWRLVEVGRVVLFTRGQYEGKLAAIVEIIDHRRVLVDAPSDASLPRHSAALKDLTLTHLVIPKLPRAAGTGVLRKLWEAEGVEKNWNGSAWAQSRAKAQRRRELTDFERFKVLRARKQQRFEVRKAFAKVRSSAKA
ncbi:hypothetical protein FH972_021217 [Carpinus fangiana]|uniref:Ribosomal protein L14e domain-containing protein n=1 Tax=Carpinus fangiana TaxID=176857 RepID=A0A5N6KPA8_9ROSI|nr:hypothetical protein FH972_021217 [Carpinus fangiana]